MQLDLLVRFISVSVTTFLYFNLKQKPLFTNNVGLLWFPFKKYLLEKNYEKDCNLEPFCFLIKSVLLRREQKETN